jgi:DNA-binding protein H-NS
MSNLVDIQAQIEKLQKQANDIKSKDLANTVQDILSKMQAFGITIKDLQTAKPAKAGTSGKKSRGKVGTVAKATKAPKKPGTAVAAKYRGPNGETWSGRGLTPKSMATLIAQGQSKGTYLIAH